MDPQTKLRQTAPSNTTAASEPEVKWMSLFQQAPAAIAVLHGPEHRYRFANPRYQKLFGRTEEALLGRTLREVFPEVEGQQIFERFAAVFATGQPFIADEFPASFIEDGQRKTGYYNFVLQPIINSHGTVTDVMVHAHDVTKQVEAHQRLKESERRLRSFIEEAPVATCFLRGREMRLEMANEKMIAYIGKGPGVVGMPLAEAMPEQVGQPYLAMLDNVYTSGETVEVKEGGVNVVVDGVPGHYYYDFTFKPMKDEEGNVYGILNAAVDVTAQVTARKRLEESQSRFRRLYDSNMIGIVTWDLAGYITQANEAFLQLLGYTSQDVDERKISWAELTPPESWPATQKGLDELATLGYFNPFEKQFYRKDGSRVDVIIGGAFYEGSSKDGVCYVLDITAQKQAAVKQAYLLQLSDALKGVSEPSEVLYEAISTLGRYFKADRVGYAEDMGDGHRVRVATNYTNGVPGIEGVYAYDDYGTELLAAFREGRTVVRPDIAGDPLLSDAEKHAHAALQLGATLNVPVLKDGRLIGVLFMHYRTAHPFSEGEIELIQETAERIRAALEKAQADKELRVSEEKYRSLFERMDQGFCIIQLLYNEGGAPVDYRFLEANPVFQTQTGLSHAVGKTALELVPNLEEKWFRIYGSVADTGQSVRFIEGSETMGRWFEVYAFRIGQAEEKKVAILFTDVTERLRMEQQLKASEASLHVRVEERTRELAEAHGQLLQSNHYLQSIINKFETAICSLLPVFEGGRIVDFTFNLTNERYSSYAGAAPEALKGRRILDVFPQYQTTDSFGRYVAIYQTGEPQHWELHYNVDGLDVHLVITASKMGEEVIVHFSDITNLKALQLDLVQKNRELLRSNENLEEFAHAASHDLKEPIRKIHFFTNQLKERLQHHLTQSESQLFQRIENSTERMGALVDDLLLYSHVSERPMEKEPVDLNDKLRRVLEDLELDVQQKGAHISITPLPTVNGYRRQLQQMLQNLLSNALKYAKAGEPPVIAVSATVEQKGSQPYHCICVADQGIGIAPVYAHKIFHMFTRLHGKHEYSGTGVGLAIVKKVVENHNGFIEVDSEEGKGAAFRVYLPV